MVRYLAPAAALAALSLGAAPVRAQTAFEGVITFRLTEPNGKQTEMTQTTKGRKLRIDGMAESPRGPGVGMIMDADAGRMVMLMPADKRAVVMTKADMDRMAAMAKGKLQRLDLAALELICKALECQPGDLLVRVERRKARNATKKRRKNNDSRRFTRCH